MGKRNERKEKGEKTREKRKGKRQEKGKLMNLCLNVEHSHVGIFHCE